MQAMHNSLKAFLLAKGFITLDQSEAEGFPHEVEQAYKSFAEHKCGVPPPRDVPTTLEQVPVQILDDEEWMYLVDEDQNEPPAEDEGEDEGEGEPTDDTSLETQPPAPTLELGDTVQAAPPEAPSENAGPMTEDTTGSDEGVFTGAEGVEGTEGVEGPEGVEKGEDDEEEGEEDDEEEGEEDEEGEEEGEEDDDIEGA